MADGLDASADPSACLVLDTAPRAMRLDPTPELHLSTLPPVGLSLDVRNSRLTLDPTPTLEVP